MEKGYYEKEKVTVLSDGTVLWRGELYEKAKDNVNNTITGDISDLKKLSYIVLQDKDSVG